MFVIKASPEVVRRSRGEPVLSLGEDNRGDSEKRVLRASKDRVLWLGQMESRRDGEIRR